MVRLKKLGGTQIEVSSLCFGTLTVGPTQKNFSPVQAGELFHQAWDLGINFFDTADSYGTYEPLSLALKKNPEMVIASRSYAVTYQEMRQSVERARRELNRDYVDIFSLHEVVNSSSLQGHRGALEYLMEAKSRGIIRAIGISTHTIAGVRAGATEPVIEVIHPLVNRRGIGIQDGDITEMVAALRTAREFGKGIYAMKILAGGHLIPEAVAAFQFINELDGIDSVAVGMQSVAEIKLNLCFRAGMTPPPEIIAEVAQTSRSLQVAAWCRACGRCVERCGFGALELMDGTLRVRQEKCVRCGYCAMVCPEFCLKII